KFHVARPAHLLDGEVVFADWNPLEVDRPVDCLHPDDGVEGVGIRLAAEIAEGGVDAFTDAVAEGGVGDLLPLQKGKVALFGADDRPVAVAPSPVRPVFAAGANAV